MTIQPISTTFCPTCREALNAADTICGDMPKMGDVTICLYCGCAAVLDKNLQLVVPGKRLSAQIERDPRIAEIQRLRRKLVRPQ